MIPKTLHYMWFGGKPIQNWRCITEKSNNVSRKTQNEMGKPVYNADGLKSEAYKTSKDYARLKTLLDANIIVVCFINYDISPQTKYLFQDICIARRINQCYQFDARGISYATWYADFPYTFEEMCEANGVEFIEPTNVSK